MASEKSADLTQTSNGDVIKDRTGPASLPRSAKLLVARLARNPRTLTWGGTNPPGNNTAESQQYPLDVGKSSRSHPFCRWVEQKLPHHRGLPHHPTFFLASSSSPGLPAHPHHHAPPPGGFHRIIHSAVHGGQDGGGEGSRPERCQIS